MKKDQDLGEMGEATFSFWCSQVALKANNSKIDKTGWDFLVEFPLSFDDGKSLDQQSGPIECRVQVKATNKRKKKVPIPLSNMVRLVEAPMPTFFMLIEFDEKDDAQSAYFLHVSDHVISNVLKRLRELDSDVKSLDLHKKNITINFAESDKLLSLNGSGLKAAIEKYIPNGMKSYVEEKIDFIKYVGFDSPRHIITFSASEEEGLKQLIDMSLGLVDAVRLSSFKSVESRFGIEKTVFQSEPDRGFIKIIDLPFIEGNIRVKEDKWGAVLKFPSKLYNSPFNIGAPENLVKIKVEAKKFTLYLSLYNKEMTVSFNIDMQKLPINELRDIVKFYYLTNASNKKYLIELEFLDKKFEFATNGELTDSDWIDVLSVVEKLKSISDRFDISNDVILNVDEAMFFREHSDRLFMLLNQPYKELSCKYEHIDGDFDISKKAVVFIKQAAPLGEYRVSILMAFIGSAELTEDGLYHFLIEKTSIEKQVIYRSCDVICESELAEEVDAIKLRYQNEGYSIANKSIL